jgi:hypothetical protein
VTTTPKTSTSIVHGRLFGHHDAFIRLNRLIAGALRGAVHDHPDIVLAGRETSIVKRVVKELVGNGYGLELFLSIVRAGQTGPEVSVERPDEATRRAQELILCCDIQWSVYSETDKLVGIPMTGASFNGTCGKCGKVLRSVGDHPLGARHWNETGELQVAEKSSS